MSNGDQEAVFLKSRLKAYSFDFDSLRVKLTTLRLNHYARGSIRELMRPYNGLSTPARFPPNQSALQYFQSYGEQGERLPQ